MSVALAEDLAAGAAFEEVIPLVVCRELGGFDGVAAGVTLRGSAAAEGGGGMMHRKLG